MILAAHAALAAWAFAIGAVVGSFLNVCIYRLPWQKSVVWPGSHCPKCLEPIAARDNIPILSWALLRGECRRCGLRIPARYALVEALVGLLFASAYVVDVASAPGPFPAPGFATMAYHQVLFALLVTATFIDYDFQIIPDEVTVTGMALGLLLGALAPGVRPDPATASTAAGGLWVGLQGLIVGGGLAWGVRLVFGVILRREAMGFGDVTLLAMIGSFLGWRAAVLAFFLAPFFGLAHAGWKLARYLRKWIAGAARSSADRELAFGPYLSMAAVALVLAWPWLWRGWGAGFFATLSAVFWFLLGRDIDAGAGSAPLAG